MEICKEYFKINNDIIDGFKVIKNSTAYNIYVYTSCVALNNWQLFLTFDTLENVKKYFNKQLQKSLEENNQKIEWNKKESEWIKNILNKLHLIK